MANIEELPADHVGVLAYRCNPCLVVGRQTSICRHLCVNLAALVLVGNIHLDRPAAGPGATVRFNICCEWKHAAVCTVANSNPPISSCQIRCVPYCVIMRSKWSTVVALWTLLTNIVWKLLGKVGMTSKKPMCWVVHFAFDIHVVTSDELS